MPGNIGFRLIVIIVGDEVFDRIVGKEFLEFGIKLGCKRFVVSHNQSRFLDLLDDVGHGECFTGAGGAKQHLMSASGTDAFNQLGYGLRLVSHGLIRCVQFKGFVDHDVSFRWIL